jgi:hypothetical protein
MAMKDTYDHSGEVNVVSRIYCWASAKPLFELALCCQARGSLPILNGAGKSVIKIHGGSHNIASVLFEYSYSIKAMFHRYMGHSLRLVISVERDNPFSIG